VENRKAKHIKTAPNGKRALYVDELNEAEIKAYWEKDDRHKDKFRFFSELLLEGLRSSKHYVKVEINSRCKNVTEMRYFVRQENDRIYCKEVRSSNGVYIIVAAILHERKKSKGLSSEEINLIEKVGGYQYDI
jgi:hypothetical protein